MSTHNRCFYGEISKIIPLLPPNTLLMCSSAGSMIVQLPGLLDFYCHRRADGKYCCLALKTYLGHRQHDLFRLGKTWTMCYGTATTFKIIRDYLSCRLKDNSARKRNTDGTPHLMESPLARLKAYSTMSQRMIDVQKLSSILEAKLCTKIRAKKWQAFMKILNLYLYGWVWWVSCKILRPDLMASILFRKDQRP